MANINITDPPSVSVTPTGNSAAPTQAAINLQNSATQASQREFDLCVGMISDVGHGNSNRNYGDKVGIYSGVVARQQSGDAWSFNPLLAIAQDVQSDFNGQVIEVDLANYFANRGETPGVGGMGQPLSLGISVTGSGDYRNNAAIAVYQPIPTQFNRGVCVVSGIAQAAFCDYSSATTSVAIEGSHSYGIDTNNMSSGKPLRLKNGLGIWSRDAANSTDLQIMAVDGTNNLILGQSCTNAIIYTHFLPAFDNTFVCGGPSNRWSTIYAANGTINTSDPTLKTDVADVPSAIDTIMAIKPKTYRWKSGGYDLVDVEEEQLVHAVEWHDTQEELIEEVNGRHVLTKRSGKRAEPAYDNVPLFDSRGNPIVDDPLPGTRGQMEPSKESHPRTIRVPRMEMRKVSVKKQVERPGRRTHWGFMAPDVKSAVDKLGLDFGGYVRDENGIEHLRYDELIPIAWKGIQELIAENRSLRERIEQLEKRKA
ncbi:MAG TPA: tail fiber domain-containing protein [Caulobacteraceae bacterium]|jgi:hypothetical protein|nr:tail fiber domain-containing protein [Caulobacteraceae bacterium]